MRYSLVFCYLSVSLLIQFLFVVDAKYTLRTFGIQSQKEDHETLSHEEFLDHMRSSILNAKYKLKKLKEEEELRRKIYRQYLEPRIGKSSVLYDLYSRFK
jgi:hypothetical protein